MRSTLLLGCSFVLAAAIAPASIAVSPEPPGPAPAAGAVREIARERHDGRSLHVGDLVPDVVFTDVDGLPGRLSDAGGAAALVIAVRETTCPLSMRYGPRLASIERDYADRNVTFLFVNFSEHDTPEAIAAERKKYGFAGRAVHDSDGLIRAAVAAETTTEVFLLDSARTLRYRGAVDDQYGIGVQRAQPRRTFLRDALDAVLAGDEVVMSATTAPGCVLPARSEAEDSTAEFDATYHANVSRVVQANCMACHRNEGVAPFALDSYEALRGRRGMIAHVLREGIMPPWGADDTGGPWRNQRRLASRDRETLLAWIDAGCPEGDEADAPLPRLWSTEWSIGEPDAVIEVPTAFRVPAEGQVEYRYEYVQTQFDEDKWVRGFEIRPGAPQVVHHVLAFAEEPPRAGESRDDRRRRWQGGLAGYFAAFVPGQGPTIYPAGVAKLLPKGAWLKFQLHYTPNGTEAFDQTKLALLFADEPPVRKMHTGAVATTRFEIPPGESDHVVKATGTFRSPLTLYALSPHMHLRGKAFRYVLTYPDGRAETLLNVPRYDFDWQTMYRLAEPRAIPAGTRIDCTAWFDNSAGNAANPDPSATVRFGEQTWDEMMIGYFEWWE